MTLRGRRRRTRDGRYRAVLVANGHHWDPRWPEPAFPGAEEFAGEQIHVHHYREPDVLVGKRVLVLGIGNSAVDIAVESSRIAEKTFLAMRRGAYVLPKFLGGKPIDEVRRLRRRLPLSMRRFVIGRMLKLTRRRDDRLRAAGARPQAARGASHGLLGAAAAARATATSRSSPTSTVSAAARRSASSTAARRRSTSSSTAPATGSPSPSSRRRVRSKDNRMPLYRRVVSVEHPGLYFIGFDPAAGADHADRRGPGRMARRPARRDGDAASAAEMRAEISAHERADEEALRRL